MNSKHTPGIVEFCDGHARVNIGLATSVYVSGPLADEISNFARLIAAAPELLEALLKCRDEMNGLPHSLGYAFTHLPMIDAAIAKATGQD